MGKIIAWKPMQAERRPMPVTDSAEILFFTGVRYYRMTDEDVAKASARKRSAVTKKKPAATPRLKRLG